MKKLNTFIESLEFRRLLTAIANLGNTPYSVDEGSSIVLDGSASSSDSGTINRYEWDFNYNGSTFDVDATSASPTFSAATIDGPTTQTIALRVTDSASNVSDIATSTVTINNVAPKATFKVWYGTAFNTSYTYSPTINSATDAAPADRESLKASFDLNNDGDFTDPGEVADQAVSLGTGYSAMSFTTSTPGLQTIHARIADKDGGYTDYYSKIDVPALNPVRASISGQTTVTEGTQYVTLSVAGSTGPWNKVTWTIWGQNYYTPSVTLSVLEYDGPYQIPVSVFVYNFQDSRSDTASTTIRLLNVAPTGTLSNSGPVAQGNPATVSFSNIYDPANSDGSATTFPRHYDVLSYSFDFNNDGDFTDPGDVANSTTPSASLSYPSPGQYTVRGRVADDDGGYNDYTTTVVVRASVTANPGGPYFVDETQSIQLSGAASTGSIYNYEWDFDYDGTTFNVDAIGIQPLFFEPSLDGPEVRTIALRVNGATNPIISTTTLTVRNVAPTADIYSPEAVNFGNPSSVVFTNITDLSVADQTAGFKYSYDFNNDGDFTDPGDISDSTSPVGSYIYAIYGTKKVHGRIMDKDGGYSDCYGSVIVLPPPPIAIAGGLYQVNEGASITLDGSSSYDPQGLPIVSYEWDFDYASGAFDVNASGAHPTFDAKFLDGPSLANIALRVTNSAGLTSTISATSVTINNLAPTGVFLNATGNHVPPGTLVQVLFGQVSDAFADSTGTWKYSFDFNNDGDFVDPGDILNSSVGFGEHIFNVAGNYTVRGRVTDKDQAYTDYTTSVIIDPVAVTGAKIAGMVFSDANKNGVKDASESGLPGIAVWLDLDGDKVIDPNETQMTTDATGNYLFQNVPQAGSSTSTRVRAVIPTGDTQILPANGYGYQVTLTPGYSNAGKNFAIYVPVITPPSNNGSIAGFSFSDSNKNGKYDVGEALQSGKTIFIDLNGNNVLDTNEVRVVTDSKGAFKFANLTAGTYKIRRVIPAGYKLTTAFSNVTISAGQNVTGIAIGSSTV